MTKPVEFFRADADGVTVMTLSETRRVSYDDFTRRLQDSRLSTPILPHGTIWYEHNNTDKLFALQLPPKRRMIAYYDRFFTIGFPSLILLVKTSGKMVVNAALALATKPIDQFEDPLRRLPLPNMDNRCILCMGWDFGIDNTQASHETARVRTVVEHVETSRYNDHLLPQTAWVPQPIRGDYEYIGQSMAGRRDIQEAKQAFYGVLERWQEYTAGDDWLTLIAETEWAPLMSFSNFVRGGI